MSRDTEPDPDIIAIDFRGRTIEIFGTVYSLDLFRALAFGPIGTVLRIVERDRVVTVQELRPDACSPGTCQLREANI